MARVYRNTELRQKTLNVMTSVDVACTGGHCHSEDGCCQYLDVGYPAELFPGTSQPAKCLLFNVQLRLYKKESWLRRCAQCLRAERWAGASPATIRVNDLV